MGRLFGLVFAVILIFNQSALAKESDASNSQMGLKKIIEDYIGLYKKETLDQWKNLFHPSLQVFFPADDGSINVRNLDEFFERQQNYFAKRKSISERSENVQVFEGRKIARVVADFVFIDEGEERPGKLGLHLIEGKDGWKIAAIIFS